jgi:hypothetical protein
MDTYRYQQAEEGRKSIGNYTQTLEPGAQQQERADVTNELRDSLQGSVNAARAAEVPGDIQGAISPSYGARVSSNNAKLQSAIDRMVSQLSVIGTPGEMGIRDARRYALTAGDVNFSNNAANDVSSRYASAIGNTRPNPYLNLGSQLLAGVGIARAGAPRGAVR